LRNSGNQWKLYSTANSTLYHVYYEIHNEVSNNDKVHNSFIKKKDIYFTLTKKKNCHFLAFYLKKLQRKMEINDVRWDISIEEWVMFSC